MIFTIHGFDDGPHFNIAVVEAASEEEARLRLGRALAASEADHASYGPNHIDTVWAPRSEDKWRVRREEPPFMFILGSGCR